MTAMPRWRRASSIAIGVVICGPYPTVTWPSTDDCSMPLWPTECTPGTWSNVSRSSCWLETTSDSSSQLAAAVTARVHAEANQHGSRRLDGRHRGARDWHATVPEARLSVLHGRTHG